VGSANQALDADSVLEKVTPLLPEVSYLYLGSCMKLKALLPAYGRLVEQAKSTDTKIIIDHGRTTNTTTPEDMAMIRQLVAHADYYFPSTDEFLALWDAPTIEAGLLGRDWGHTRVALKDGPQGAIGLVDGALVRVPAYNVKPVNTVGAGDAFNAGVIAVIETGVDFSSALAFGCATAGLKISKPGLPTFDAVKQLVRG
jgi:sugar/nucleoside kinase (ribokinase family)